MLPTETAFIYFYVLLAGFMTVWTYRWKIDSKKEIGQFEYIGFSAFWGIALIIFLGYLEKIHPPLVSVFSNPFATGFILSFIGMACAYIVGDMSLLFQNIHKFGWKMSFRKFIKKEK